MDDRKSILFQLIKEKTVEHLQQISNQNVTVPVPGFDHDYMVKDLILEVISESPIGIQYMIEYVKTMYLLIEI